MDRNRIPCRQPRVSPEEVVSSSLPPFVYTEKARKILRGKEGNIRFTGAWRLAQTESGLAAAWAPMTSTTVPTNIINAVMERMTIMTMSPAVSGVVSSFV